MARASTKQKNVMNKDKLINSKKKKGLFCKENGKFAIILVNLSQKFLFFIAIFIKNFIKNLTFSMKELCQNNYIFILNDI